MLFMIYINRIYTIYIYMLPHPLMMILMKNAVKQVVREGGGWPHLVNPTDPALSGVQAANLVLATGLRTRTCLITIIIMWLITRPKPPALSSEVMIFSDKHTNRHTLHHNIWLYHYDHHQHYTQQPTWVLQLKATGGRGVHLP